MIYLDSSVALAHLLLEPHKPADGFWRQRFVSSRLLAYEVWNRLNIQRLTHSHETETRQLFDRVALMQLTPAVLERALKPFPISVRTLDSMHLASMEYLRGAGQIVQLASYDQRLLAAANALGIETIDF